MPKRFVVAVLGVLFLILPFQLVYADSLPLCSDHDPQQWHALIRHDGACHYDHEHKDDPNFVNGIFGEPGDWWGQPGQSISYPWVTSEMENTMKHGGFGWMVRWNLPCTTPPCLSAFRVQYHAVMSQMGMETRYHSHSAEYLINNGDGSYGMVRRGGWLDFGGLVVNLETKIPPGISESSLAFRFHAEPTDYALQIGAPAAGVWYGEPVAYMEPMGLLGRIGIRTEDAFGRYQDDGSLHFYPYDNFNNSTLTVQVVEVVVRPVWDTTMDGRVNLRGYTDRDGRLVYVERWGDGNKLIAWYGVPEAPESVAVGLDTIPLIVENAPVGMVINQYKETVPREYDSSPPGESWIVHPN